MSKFPSPTSTHDRRSASDSARTDIVGMSSKVMSREQLPYPGSANFVIILASNGP